MANSNVEIVDPQTFPYLPPKLTALRMRHFDPQVFKTDESSRLYKFVDALAGDVGAGQLKKQLLLTRLSANLDTMYFGDLDASFGNIEGLTRLVSETYVYDPTSNLLTSDQWNEIQVKDAWYRQRIRDFFQACSMGGTPDGIRMMLRAALGVDCDVFELWRYIDDYNRYVETEFQVEVTAYGRLSPSIRNEFVVRPHKASLTPSEWLIATKMIERIKPADSVVTVSTEGLSVHSLVNLRSVSADSSYFIVERKVTGVPDLAKLPQPDIDLDNLKWLQANVPNVAPTTAFGQTQEHSYYYLYSETNANSAIDQVTYQIEDVDGNRSNQSPLVQGAGQNGYGKWYAFDKVDSPDNYPGGKFGQTPLSAPALYPNGDAYQFLYKSQAEYISKVSPTIIARGGQIEGERYRLPNTAVVASSKTRFPQLSLATVEPTRDSTVSSIPFVRVPGQNIARIQADTSGYPYSPPT